MKDFKINQLIEIPVGRVSLTGELIVPSEAIGIVIFSHGSGSSRLSSRNKFVAKKLLDNNIATFMFDLLTLEEDQYYTNRFNIELLTERLIAATEWLRQKEETQDLNFGYFGASTGAASALSAAARLGNLIKAVVSRGGRPDLAAPSLPFVEAPTLLLVGGLDYYVISLNEQAFSLLDTQKKLVVVKEATHLFEEIGKLEEVANYASLWFRKYLKQEELIIP